MTLTQITKIRGPGIHTTSNIVSHNINSSGIITAVAFKGPFTGSSNIQSGILTATKIDLNGDIDVDGHTNLDNVSVAGVSTFSGDATFSGNVSIGGTLTYEDVTNIDAVGLVTARAGVNISDTTESTSTTTGALKVAGGAGIVKNLNVGGDATFSDNVSVADTKEIRFGSSNELKLSNNGNSAYMQHSGSGYLFIHGNDIALRSTSQKNYIVCDSDQEVSLYFNNSKKIETTNTGAVVTGILTATSNVEIAHGTGQAHYQITQTNGNTVKMGIVSGSDFEISGSSNNNIIFKRAGSTRLTVTSDGATVAPNLTANSVLSSYGGIQTKLGFISGGSEGFTGTISNHSLFIKTADTNRIKISNTSAATSIGGLMQFNALLTTQGDVSGGLLMLKAAENTNRLFVSGSDSNGVEVNLYDEAGGQKGILGVSGSEFFIKATNNSAPLTFYTHNGSSIGERLRIDSAGRLRIANTNFGASGDADTLIVGTTSGTRGISIISGNNNTGNLTFGDTNDNDVGGVIYNHNGDTLNFRANGLTRATVTSTAFWVDDGTNARLKLAPDGTNLNMIISTTTNNGSYCNLLYGAVDHIFKYGGNETARLTSTGNYTITGEFASAQDYPNFRPTLDLNFVAVKKLDPRFTFQRSSFASYTDEKGIVRIVGDNTPRFDHDPETGESKGLLIEEARTSRLTQSTHNDAYSHYQQTDRGETIKGPDGVENSAREYTPNSNAGTGGSTTIWANEAIGMASGVCVSYFVKITRGSTMAFQIMDNNNARESEKITISGGYITDGSYATVSQSDPGNTEGTTSYERYPNGWVRVKWEGASGSGNATSYIQLYIYDHANSNGTNIGYAIWGFQVENGPTCTSVISKPSTDSITRGAETVTMEGEEFSDFYNQEEGTLVLSASYTEDIRGSAMVVIDDTSNESEYTEVGYRSGGGSSGTVGSYIRTDAGNDQYYKGFTSSATQGNEFKVALAYKDNDYASSVNGQTVHTDTSGTTSKVYDRLRFSDVDTFGVVGSGYYRRFMYYRKRLSNTQVVTLTS